MIDLSKMNADEILLSVERPSRYTGGEVNAVRKDPGDGSILRSLSRTPMRSGCLTSASRSSTQS